MTRTELRARLLRALNDDPVAPVYWTPRELNEVLQEGMELLAEEVPVLTRTFSIPRRPGTWLYHCEGIGERIQTPYRIWLPDLHRRLEAWSITDLDARHEQWLTVTGDPWAWAPVDWQTFIIWPIPATGGGWLEVDTYVWPDELEADHESPEFRAADHAALVTWGEAEGYLKQQMTAQAVEREAQFVERWGNARSRNGVEQMQAAFRVRGRVT